MSERQENSAEFIPLDLREALDSFSRESQEVLDSFSAQINAAEPPALIYHYTNDVGLRGILETGQLWLSDIFNLNDPSELTHGFSLAVDILKRKAANGSEETKQFLESLENFSKPERFMNAGNYFICSFSSRGNELGQWRAYADNGRGYAIGFEAKALEMAFVSNGCDDPAPPAQAPKKGRPFLGTFPLTYSDSRLTEIYTEIIDRMFALISLPHGRDLTHPVRVSFLAKLATTLVVRVLLAGLHFKHEAYNNEMEYRFLEGHGRMERWQVKLRPRPYSLTRYREFHWKRTAAKAIKHIVVGPAADHQKGFQFAQDCVRMFCSYPVDITSSHIPYRAL